MVSMDGEVEVASYPLHFQPAMYVAALMLVQCSIHGCIFLYIQDMTIKIQRAAAHQSRLAKTLSSSLTRCMSCSTLSHEHEQCTSLVPVLHHLLRSPECEWSPLLLRRYVFTQALAATISIDAYLVQLSIVCYADRIVIPVTSRDVHSIQADGCIESSQDSVSTIRAKPGRVTKKAATHLSDSPAQGRAGNVKFKVILRCSPLDTSTPIWSANRLFKQFNTCQAEAEQAAEPP